MPATPAVLCIGELLIDLIVSDGSTRLEEAVGFTARPGGAPANVAAALVRLGVPSAFCGAVGDDPFGRKLLDVLRSNGIDADTLAIVPGEHTTLAFAWTNARGDGEFEIVRLADTSLSVEMVEAARPEERAAIVVGSVVLPASGSRAAVYRAAELASAAGVPVCFDVNIRPPLWSSPEMAREACEPVFASSTIVKLSLDDSRFLFDEVNPASLFQMARFAGKTLLLTDGSRGAWFRTDTGAIEHVPAFDIEPVEPTGAGDAFTAAIVARYLGNGRGPDRADVEFASAAGAITATRIGAIESLPTFREIEQFLGNR